jgi:outer membrane protein assembly factor BamD
MRPWSPSRWFGLAALTVSLAACGGANKDAYIEKPVDDLYNQAMDEMVEERYAPAAKTFEQVESQHPYSVWATKSQLMSAYAMYEADQKTTELALKALEDVIRRFPDTRYARDAKLKLAFTRDHLAGKEMEIGRYYLKRGQYLAAINRFKRVIDNYQTTTHVPEALERLVECDLALGLNNEAKRNAAVLGYNYPGSEWYGDAYAMLKGAPEPDAQTQSWLSRLF